MNDQQIVAALIARDERVTRQFFFKDCRPLFLCVIKNVFSYSVDYDEFVNEFYVHLMENDAYRLKQFTGRSSIYQWLKVVAIRYFMAKRDCVINMEPKDSLIDCTEQKEADDGEQRWMEKIDMNSLLGLMSNKRYVYVIRRIVLEEANPKEVAKVLRTNVDNLYNLKKRAIAALTRIALYEVEKYGKEIKK